MLDALIVLLQFSVGLRMVGYHQGVTDPYQIQVRTGSRGYLAQSIVTQQSGPILHGHFCHTTDINS